MRKMTVDEVLSGLTRLRQIDADMSMLETELMDLNRDTIKGYHELIEAGNLNLVDKERLEEAITETMLSFLKSSAKVSKRLNDDLASGPKSQDLN